MAKGFQGSVFGILLIFSGLFFWKEQYWWAIVTLGLMTAFAVLMTVGLHTIKKFWTKWGGFERHITSKEERKIATDIASKKELTPKEKEEIKPLLEEAKKRTEPERSPEDYLVLASEEWRAKRFDSALDMVWAGLALKPENKRVKSAFFNLLGLIYLSQKKLKLSEEMLKEAKILDPEYPAPYNNLGNLYREQGKHDEAKQEFREAIRLNPKLAKAHGNLGNLYREQGKYNEAEQELQEAIRLDPELAIPHNNLGSVCAITKQFKEAAKAFQKAVELDPNNKAIQDNLKKLRQEMKDSE